MASTRSCSAWAPQSFEAHVRETCDYVRLAERVIGPIPRRVDAGYIWGDALAELRRAGPRLRIVNLETAITTADDAWPGQGHPLPHGPANVACLDAAAIDSCTLTNNHVLATLTQVKASEHVRPTVMVFALQCFRCNPLET